ncbi:MAG: sulfatase [Cytophagales bacterium]|nr:sulfatase [Cytophagales bacterium]
MNRKHTISVLASMSLILIFNSCMERTSGQKPNILFIAIDDMNDWIGVLGGHPMARTPNIDKLAGQGVLFTNAHTPAPACSPCRNAILYGMQPHNSGLYPFYDRNKLEPEFFEKHKSLMELFRANGYNTYGAGKIHHGNMKRASIERFDSLEFTESINTQLLELPDPVVDSTVGTGSKEFRKMCARPSLSPLEDHVDYNISKFGVEVLKRKHEKPFFLAVGFIKPHLPFVAPKKYFDMFPREEIRKTQVRDDDLADLPWVARSNAKLNDDYNYRSKNTWEDWIRAYLACNAYTDENVGRVVEALNSSPYKDNTIIVLWSDHGYHFGEKRSHRKFSLWEESTRVPFIILDPENASNGKVCDAPVSLIDIYPTLLNYAGIEIPEYSDGLDLTELLQSPDTGRKIPALTTWGRGNYSLRSFNWRYTVYFDGSEELYNHQNDPYEWDNLAENPEYHQIKNELKKYLPATEAPLVMQGKTLHNIVDADQPSLDKFKKLWSEMQKRGMNLE